MLIRRYNHSGGTFMKRCLAVMALSFFITSSAFAKDFKSPHKLVPGQTLSADVLNEIIDALSFSEMLPTRDDFLGSWSCRRTFSRVVEGAEPDWSPYHDQYSPVMEQDLLYTVTGSMVFSVDQDGKYRVTDQHPQILLMEKDNSEYWGITDEIFATKDGLFYFSYKHIDLNITYSDVVYKVDFRGSDRFELTDFKGSSHYEIAYGNNPKGKIVCDKTNIPSAIPEDSEISLSGSSATITWSDRSEDETGFVIVRRDSLNGQWEEIATVSAVAGTGTTISYTDPNLTTGTYWYRVKSVNIHGKSLGSNVVKIEI